MASAVDSEAGVSVPPTTCCSLGTPRSCTRLGAVAGLRQTAAKNTHNASAARGLCCLNLHVVHGRAPGGPGAAAQQVPRCKLGAIAANFKTTCCNQLKPTRAGHQPPLATRGRSSAQMEGRSSHVSE
jgi:hypothetical protein